MPAQVALVVIDMQEAYFQDPALASQRRVLSRRVNSAIRLAELLGLQPKPHLLCVHS